MREGDKQLVTRQQMFILEYLVDMNGRQAAIRAGYSARSAKDAAKHNLKIPKIANAIKQEIEERKKRTHVSADDCITKLNNINSKTALKKVARHLGVSKIENEIRKPLLDRLNKWRNAQPNKPNLSEAIEQIISDYLDHAEFLASFQRSEQ